MLALIALAAAVSAPQTASEPLRPTVQAAATVRIISGVRLNLASQSNGADVPAPRDAIVQSGGITQSARLIEFQ